MDNKSGPARDLIHKRVLQRKTTRDILEVPLMFFCSSNLGKVPQLRLYPLHLDAPVQGFLFLLDMQLPALFSLSTMTGGGLGPLMEDAKQRPSSSKVERILVLTWIYVQMNLNDKPLLLQGSLSLFYINRNDSVHFAMSAILENQLPCSLCCLEGSSQV